MRTLRKQEQRDEIRQKKRKQNRTKTWKIKAYIRMRPKNLEPNGCRYEREQRVAGDGDNEIIANPILQRARFWWRREGKKVRNNGCEREEGHGAAETR